MRHAKKALHHLSKARAAMQHGDTTSGMHHVGHAMVAMRAHAQHPLADEPDGDEAAVAEPVAPLSAPQVPALSPQAGLLARLRQANAKSSSS